MYLRLVVDMMAGPSPSVVDWASRLPPSPTFTGGRNLLDVRARLQHNAPQVFECTAPNP